MGGFVKTNSSGDAMEFDEEVLLELEHFGGSVFFARASYQWQEHQERSHTKVTDSSSGDGER